VTPRAASASLCASVSTPSATSQDRATSKPDLDAIVADFGRRGQVVPWQTSVNSKGRDTSGPDVDAIFALYKGWGERPPWKEKAGNQRVRVIAKVSD
jgi:hypothetical protein